MADGGALDEAALAAIVVEVVRTYQLVHDADGRRVSAAGRKEWSDACEQARAAVIRFEAFVDGVEGPLRNQQPGSTRRAIRFLELDPWCFRSGYAKGRILRRLTRAALTVDERDRLVDVVLNYVDRGGRLELRDATRLGRRLGGTRLRVELRQRLHGSDVGAARRALWALLDLRRPRLTPDDLVVARRLTRDEPG